MATTMTHRVSRAELYSPSPSPPSPPPPDTVPTFPDLEFAAIPVLDQHRQEEGDEGTDQELDFPLFAGPAPQRIALCSPTPPPAAEAVYDAFAHAQTRPLSAYLVPPEALAGRRRAEFACVAVRGEDLLGQAASLPVSTRDRCQWKVIHIPPPAFDRGGSDGGSSGAGRRKRPGKKRRILIRVRRKQELAHKEACDKSQRGRDKFVGLTADQKAALANEDRVRRNREKKLKRRQRERAKKAAAAALRGTE